MFHLQICHSLLIYKGQDPWHTLYKWRLSGQKVYPWPDVSSPDCNLTQTRENKFGGRVKVRVRVRERENSERVKERKWVRYSEFHGFRLL